MKPPLIAVLLILACGVAGFLAYRQFATVPPAAPVAAAAPSVDPAAAADGAAASAKPPVPEMVPDIRLQDVAGKLHALHEYRGAPTIINFWATWCAPCRREIPLLNTLRHDYGGQRLQVVGIAVDFKEAVAEFVKKTQLDYPLLVGEQDGVDAAARFGMELVLPFSIFVDSAEHIVAVKVGELHREEADAILAGIHSLDQGTISLPLVRKQIADRLRQLAVERAQKKP
jgi:thiol-disulfide isomerase/thioredoxin